MFKDDDLRRNGTTDSPTSWSWKHPREKTVQKVRDRSGRLQRIMNPHRWFDGYITSDRVCKECTRLGKKSEIPLDID